jgi:hypothetical protein
MVRIPVSITAPPGDLYASGAADYFSAGGITLHWFGFGTHLPSGHIVPEQQMQNSPVCGIDSKLSGGGTSFKAPLQITTTASGAPSNLGREDAHVRIGVANLCTLYMASVESSANPWM